MANIASGSFTIEPASEAFYEDLCARISALPGVFSYGGEADVVYDGTGIRVGFSGRWACRAAWDVLDGLLADREYVFRNELIASRIDGRASESSLGYYEGVRKEAGKRILKRRQK